MPAELADKMKETAAVEHTEVADTGSDTGSEDTGSETGSESAEPEGEAGDTGAESEPEPETKSDLFMSPGDKKFQEQKAAVTKAAKAPKAKMPDSVRSRIAAEERSKLEAETPWAQGISKEEGTSLREFRDLANQDPIRLIDRMIRGAATNPVLRQRLEGYLQHLYTPPAKVAADEMPQPDTPQGYTTEGLKKLNEWNQRQVMKQVTEQMAPLVADRKTATEAAQTQHRSQAYGTRAIGLVSNRPGFQENVKDIQAAFNAAPRFAETHPQFREEAEILLDAYHTVTSQKTIEAKQKKWAADQKAKAGIGTVSGVGTTGATTIGKPKTMREAVERAAKQVK
jgi:hypothetical protein